MKSERRAAFVGWVSNMIALELMFKEYVETGRLEKLMTFRMSQDPLELFFGCIRATLGANNNPTILQFKGAFVRLLAGALLKAAPGANVLWDDDMRMIEVHEASQDVDVNVVDVITNAMRNNLDSLVRQNALCYISGYVQRKVSQKLECQSCTEFFTGDDDTGVSCTLLKRVDRGNLVKPCEDVVALLELVDWVIEFQAKCDDILSSKNVFRKLEIMSLKLISERKPLLLKDLCSDPSHKLMVMKSLISLFLNVKLGHMCRQRNLANKTLTRHIHKKMPIFNHE